MIFLIKGIHRFFGTLRTITGCDVQSGVAVDEFLNCNPVAGAGAFDGRRPHFFTNTAYRQQFFTLLKFASYFKLFKASFHPVHHLFRFTRLKQVIVSLVPQGIYG
jgi:hypothetical protein